jgi:hypothetical protein
LRQFPLNHYVVLEGEVPSDVMVVLNKWLGEMNSQLLTERLWIYSKIESAEPLDNFAGILEGLGELLPTEDWKPFRVWFLRPHGNGCFSYKMSTVSSSDDGGIGGGAGSF